MNNTTEDNKPLTVKEDNKEIESYEVYLYQYDITNGMATKIAKFMTGRDFPAIWHTSLVVYGREYYFGGGIMHDYPKFTPYGTPIKESLFGSTNKTQKEFEDYLKTIGDEYSFATYHILNHNCNHFTNGICLYLTGKPLPDDIINQHTLLSDTAFGKWALGCVERLNAKMAQVVPKVFEGEK